MGGATEEFKRGLREAFDALAVGQTYTFRRTFTEGDVSAFCGVTGDYNPYHIDDTFARDGLFGRRIVPGLLTGSMLTHIGGLLGFLAAEMSFRFVAPVYIGDTVTCTVTVEEKDAARRAVACGVRAATADGREVLVARFSGFPGQVRLAR